MTCNILTVTQEIIQVKIIYGFKTTCVPPKNEFLTGFENDIYSLVKSIEFRKKDNEFLSKMKNDIKEVVESDKVFISADKTSKL